MYLILLNLFVHDQIYIINFGIVVSLNCDPCNFNHILGPHLGDAIFFPNRDLFMHFQPFSLPPLCLVSSLDPVRAPK